MERLRSGYTEVWVPSTVCPLIQLADCVRAISSTGLDLIGIDSLDASQATVQALAGFDEIVSWYGTNRPEFRKAVLGLNPNWRFLPALPPLDSTLHVTDFYAQAAGAPCGLRPVLRVPSAPVRRSAVIQPFSGSPRKNWPLDRFQQLAQKLPLPVEWVAGPEENLPDARRFENLWQLAGWISSASVYIGNDSGITHLAAATGVPTVALFGATDARVWSPRGENVTLVASDSMEGIVIDDVLRAVVKTLPEAMSPALGT
jgi:heptosyltransferase III